MVAAWYKEVKQTIAALNQKKKDLENRNRVEVADIILAFDEKGFKIKSFVAVDNFNQVDQSDPHVFLQPKALPLSATLKRLIRKNAKFK